MDAVFSKADLLPKAQLQQLLARRDGPGLRRLGAQAALYFGSAVGLACVDHPVAIAGLLVVSAVVQFGMFGMLHEACHKTAFATRWLNTLASWIAALAQPMGPALMEAFHFHHHRHTHVLAEDPELGGLVLMRDWPRGLMWLVTMSGLPVLFARVAWTTFAAVTPPAWDGAWTAVLRFVKPERRRRIAWEARLLVAIHATAITAAILWVPGLGWVYAGMALAHAILSVYITCEHRGLPEQGTILERTRTLVTPGWVRWLLWNMPYHAEHHAWPAVPWFALPTLHEQVRPHLVHVVRPRTLHATGGRGPDLQT